MSFIKARPRPSWPCRTSAASGSTGALPGSCSSAACPHKLGGKGTSLLSPTSPRSGNRPPIRKQKILDPRPRPLKRLISSLTHFERAADGEQTTIRLSEFSNACVIFPLRSLAVASSSRSRKIGVRRREIIPAPVLRPTKRRGTR